MMAELLAPRWFKTTGIAYGAKTDTGTRYKDCEDADLWTRCGVGEILNLGEYSAQAGYAVEYKLPNKWRYFGRQFSQLVHDGQYHKAHKLLVAFCRGLTEKEVCEVRRLMHKVAAHSDAVALGAAAAC